mmetsp:Transcript_8036/g.11597  ORF Transcript_8036/g.11597 Transcript_8036/m.11597 type:complete len:214 (+) Transcript_8036:57-698(+)
MHCAAPTVAPGLGAARLGRVADVGLDLGHAAASSANIKGVLPFLSFAKKSAAESAEHLRVPTIFRCFLDLFASDRIGSTPSRLHMCTAPTVAWTWTLSGRSRRSPTKIAIVEGVLTFLSFTTKSASQAKTPSHRPWWKPRGRCVAQCIVLDKFGSSTEARVGLGPTSRASCCSCRSQRSRPLHSQELPHKQAPISYRPRECPPSVCCPMHCAG